MAEMLQFDLVSPERRLAAFEAHEVSVPGAEGDMTAMAGHMPLVTALRPGMVRAVSDKGESTFVVTQGMVEITATSVSVLAEQAFPSAEAPRETLEAMLAEARAAAAAAEGAGKDAAEKHAADLAELIARLG